jgi:hypothetical protein
VQITAPQCGSWRQSDRQSLHQAGGPWLSWHTEVYMGLSIYCYKSFIFSRSLIGIASPYRTLTSQHRHPRWMRLLLRIQAIIIMTLMVKPSTSEPSPIQAVAPLCLFVFIKQANGPSQCCLPPPPGCRTITDVAVGLMQAVLAPEHLSSLPSHTLRPVFINELLFCFCFPFFDGTHQLCVSIFSSI